jgi:hypothetical protein
MKIWNTEKGPCQFPQGVVGQNLHRRFAFLAFYFNLMTENNEFRNICWMLIAILDVWIITTKAIGQEKEIQYQALDSPGSRVLLTRENLSLPRPLVIGLSLLMIFRTMSFCMPLF